MWQDMELENLKKYKKDIDYSIDVLFIIGFNWLR